MPGPGSTITDAERGLSTTTSLTTTSLAIGQPLEDLLPPLTSADHDAAGAALDRLAAVYEAAERHGWLPLTPSALPGRADNFFYIVLGDVYSTDLDLGARDRAYRADFDLAVSAIEAASVEWAMSTLSDHSDELSELEAQMTSAPVLAPLLSAVATYFERLERLPTRHVVVDLPHQPIDPLDAPIVVEDPVIRSENERHALSAVDHPYLAVLFGHPSRRAVFHELRVAPDAEAASLVLRRLFSEAQRGTSGLRYALAECQSHVWRYPTIVVGGLAKLGMDDDESVVRWALDIAQLRSGSEWDTPLLVAGVALAAAGLVVSGPAGWAILAADLAATGLSVYEEYARAREADLAEAASAFRTGAPFADRGAGSLDTALAAAAGIIIDAALARGLFQLLGSTRRLARPTGVLRAAPPPPPRPRRGRPRRPRWDRGPHAPPAEAMRQRKAVGLDRPDTNLDLTSAQARALGLDARAADAGVRSVEQLDVRAATRKGAGRPAQPRPRASTRSGGADAPPRAVTPLDALPKFNRAQVKRLRDIQLAMHEHALTWNDLGLASESDVVSYFARFDDPSLAIETLERRLAQTLDLRAHHAEPQLLRTTTPPKGSIAPASPEGRGIGLQETWTAPKGHRLPRATELPERGGYWADEHQRGNCDWFSDVDAVNEITGYEPIPFREGVAQFGRWARERVKLSEMTGIDHVDFAAADRGLLWQYRRQYPRRWRNQTAVDEWRQREQLTWHHEPDLETMTLVPTPLHANVPHIGGASPARKLSGR